VFFFVSISFSASFWLTAFFAARYRRFAAG